MDEVLQGGRTSPGVVRRGATVRRPMGPHSPMVHGFLRHLESVGFAGAPKVLEVDSDIEVLSYLAGEVPADPHWQPGKGNPLSAEMRSEAALAAVATMLRELHAAATGFDPSTVDEMVRLRAGEVMSHGDLGPWNTVYRDGRPVALIDWDACGPVDPMLDVAGAAWSYVPLAPDNRLAETGFDPLPDIAQRLRLFVDSYGVTDRTAILPALVKSMLGAAAQVRHWQLGATDSAVTLEFIANELRWLGANSARIERALL